MNARRFLKALFQSPEPVELTEGPILRPLCYLALPVVVTNLMQTIYNLVDTLWLGRYSTTALAASTFAFPMVFLFLSTGTGVAIAGSVMVAQRLGADDRTGAETVATQTLTVTLLLSVVVGALAFVGVDDLLRSMGVAPEVVDGASAYLRIIAVGMPFTFGFVTFLALMRGAGNTRTPMLIMAGSVAVNLVLDPLAIFGVWIVPELGIRGAAIATVIARGLATIAGIWIMARGAHGIQISADDLVPRLDYVRELVSIGAPASLEEIGRALSINLLLFVVGTLPTAVAAGYGIGVRVISFVVLPTIGFASGIETMTGQNVGAGERRRVERTNYLGATLLFCVLTVVGLAVWIGARLLAGAFTDDPTVESVAVSFLRIVAPTFGCIGVMHAFVGGFRGLGRTAVAATIVLVVLGLVRVPIAWFGLAPLGRLSIWTAFAVSNVVGALLAAGWFTVGSHRSVVEEPSRSSDEVMEPADEAGGDD